jgi:hypothetical protein
MSMGALAATLTAFSSEAWAFGCQKNPGSRVVVATHALIVPHLPFLLAAGDLNRS